MNGQFNFTGLRSDAVDAGNPAALVRWLNIQFNRLAQALPGAKAIALGTLAATKTVKLAEADLIRATLGADCAITLDLDSTRAGAVGFLELTQDGTGTHVVTWTNALWTASTPPTITATANKRTLIRFVHVGTAWVGAVHASNY